MELKVMTYNVHSCCGRDRKASPSAIAEVIASGDAEIVALQELDAGLRRTGFIDQSHSIAESLKMNCCFSPTLWLEDGRYGSAILSKYPLLMKKAEGLPTLERPKGIEPRGAIWAEVTIGTLKIQVFNTHLGLKKKERMLQINRLAGSEWLNHPDCREPIIFCGDLNALPNSAVVKRVRGMLVDAQLAGRGTRPGKTYPSWYPLFRLDYIFVSKDIEVKSVAVLRSPSIVRASDHLPLIAKVEVRESD